MATDIQMGWNSSEKITWACIISYQAAWGCCKHISTESIHLKANLCIRLRPYIMNPIFSCMDLIIYSCVHVGIGLVAHTLPFPSFLEMVLVLSMGCLWIIHSMTLCPTPTRHPDINSESSCAFQEIEVAVLLNSITRVQHRRMRGMKIVSVKVREAI